MSQQNYTAKELELIDLTLDALSSGTKEAHEKFLAARRQCLLERYHRSNPEWRDQFKRAHAERAAAQKRYWDLYRGLCAALGNDVVDRLESMLDKGDDPFA